MGVGNKYRHYKGRVYTLLAMGTMKETGVSVVIYNDKKGKVWVRTTDNFYGPVLYEGQQVSRFKKVC